MRKEIVLKIYSGMDGLSGSVRGLFVNELSDGTLRTLYCINGTSKSIRNMGYLRALFQADFVVKASLPTIGFFASIFSIARLSDEILGVK